MLWAPYVRICFEKKGVSHFFLLMGTEIVNGLKTFYGTVLYHEFVGQCALLQPLSIALQYFFYFRYKNNKKEN